MDNDIKDLLENSKALISKIPSILDGIKSEMIKYCGNEEKVNEYFQAVMNKDEDKAEMILNELKDGK